jgi:hypothetical protein
MELITQCTKRFPGEQMFFDLPPVVVKKIARKGMRSSKRYRVRPMPFSLSIRQLTDLVDPVPGIRAVRDVPVPRGRGLFFKNLFPAFWQVPADQSAQRCLRTVEIRLTLTD